MVTRALIRDTSIYSESIPTILQSVSSNAAVWYPRWIDHLREKIDYLSNETYVILPLSMLLPASNGVVEIGPDSDIVLLIAALAKARKKLSLQASLLILTNFTRWLSQLDPFPDIPWLHDFVIFALSFLPIDYSSSDETVQACLTAVMQLLKKSSITVKELNESIEGSKELFSPVKAVREVRDHRIWGQFFQIDAPADKQEMAEMDWQKWDLFGYEEEKVQESEESGEPIMETVEEEKGTQEKSQEKSQETSREKPQEKPQEISERVHQKNKEKKQQNLSQERDTVFPKIDTQPPRIQSKNLHRKRFASVPVSRVKPNRIVHSGFSDSDDASEENTRNSRMNRRANRRASAIADFVADMEVQDSPLESNTSGVPSSPSPVEFAQQPKLSEEPNTTASLLAKLPEVPTEKPSFPEVATMDGVKPPPSSHWSSDDDAPIQVEEEAWDLEDETPDGKENPEEMMDTSDEVLNNPPNESPNELSNEPSDDLPISDDNPPNAHIQFHSESSSLAGSLLLSVHRAIHFPSNSSLLPAMLSSTLELFPNNRGIRAAFAYDLLMALQTPGLPHDSAGYVIQAIIETIGNDKFLCNSVSDLTVELVKKNVETRSSDPIINLTNLIGSLYQKNPDDRFVSTFLQIALFQFSVFIHLETPPSEKDRIYVISLLPPFSADLRQMNSVHARFIIGSTGLNVIFLVSPLLPHLFCDELDKVSDVIEVFYSRCGHRETMAELMLRISITMLHRLFQLQNSGNEVSTIASRIQRFVLDVSSSNKSVFRDVIRTASEDDRKVLEISLRQAAQEKKKTTKKSPHMPLKIDPSQYTEHSPVSCNKQRK